MNAQSRRSRDSETARAIRAALERRAAAFAESQGLDHVRVLKVLERTTRWRAEGRASGSSGTRADTEPDLDFAPSFEDALDVLEPEAALALFESEDTGRLAEREAAFWYITSDTTPLYTTDELADLIVAFMAHLERNRDPLLRTGHPQTDFSRAWWLDWHLTKLYYTKLPVAIRMVRNRQAGDFERSYVWGEELELDQSHLEGGGRTYEDEPIFESLDPADADRLEASRGKVLAAKVAVLERLATALRRRDAKGLWPNCLQVLTEAFLADEVDFFLRIDRSYTGFDVLSGAVIDEDADLIAGGLTDLLEVVGHCEKELSLGTMDRTKRRFQAVPDGLALHSYYEAVGQPWRRDVDTALDRFIELDTQDLAFWNGFRQRVNEALENEFSEEVVIRTRIKRKLRAKFEPQVATFAEWQKAQLEATGALPVLQLTQPSPEPPREQVFRKEGEYWVLAFEGRETRLRHRLGLSYVANLLRHPGQDVAAFDLQAAAGRVRATAPEAGGRAGHEESLRVAGFGDSGETLDDQATAAYKQHLVDLREELGEAGENVDRERAAEIREQMEWIEDQLTSAYGLGGRRRKAGDVAERIRKAVSKAVGEAIAAIQREHPALGQHLANSIQTGTLCRYQPERLVSWDT